MTQPQLRQCTRLTLSRKQTLLIRIECEMGFLQRRWSQMLRRKMRVQRVGTWKS